jgi:ABC-type Fe3+ transport system substrate-binding protein
MSGTAATHPTAGALLGAALLLAAAGAQAAALPRATETMLRDLHMLGDPLVADLDTEVNAVPPGLAEAAQKEGSLTISGSMRDEDFRKMVLPFRERYPGIALKYVSGDTNMRTVTPLVAYRQGKILDDIVEGLGNNLSEYRAAGALVKIDDLPNYRNIPPEIQDPEGYWVAPRLRYWGMTYNTDRVKPSELPRTWDDLLTEKSLFNGRVGVLNRPNNFMINLWGAKGPDWSKNFIDKLFNEVKPQFRAEGSDAVVELVAAGEVDLSVPTADYRTWDVAQKGAPVAWFSPEPVPLSFSAMAVINNSPHLAAARLYVNWFLSKEGQVAQFYAEQAPPSHKGLQDARFLVYPKEILGKSLAPRFPKLLEQDMATVQKLWDQAWQKSSSKSR